MNGRRLRVLVAHPFPDLYGADLMLVRSLHAMQRAGWEAVLAVPEAGPLLDRLVSTGISARVVPFPVLRRSLLSGSALPGLLRDSVTGIRRIRRMLREVAPDVVYVNTLTLPHWLVAARAERVPAVCHVRELESQTGRVVATGLTAPLLLARAVVANSAATRSFLLRHHPGLARRTRVIYNGYDFPQVVVPPVGSARAAGRKRLTVVGRLSPRKGQDVAVRATAMLVGSGHDVELELVGSPFRGYEWFEHDLLLLAAELGVSDRLIVSGFQPDVFPALDRADVVLVPSRLEPFGSVAVEALAAGRPLVASAVGGLPEIVVDRISGLVVPPDDPDALATAVAELLDDGGLANDLARTGHTDVRARFRLERYERELLDTLRAVSGVTA